MHDVATLMANAVTERPGPRQVCLFQAALWGPACELPAALRRMRPAFTVGGFPLPPFRRHRMLVIEAETALPPAGGYVEDAGRNPRFAGCSVSRLVMPRRRGDACVDHLHIAPGTAEREHVHPSECIGMAVRGRGLAHHEAGPPMALYPGRAWRIPAGERHRFQTGAEALDILVFRPDSECGAAGEARRMRDVALA